MTLTYTLVDDASGQFSLDGAQLKVAGALTAGTQQVVVRATDSNGWTKDKTIDIEVGEFSNAEAAAYVAAMSSAPDAPRKVSIDTFVTAIKHGATSSSNILAKCDAIYLLASHNADAALINLVDPGTYDLALVGAPTFVVDEGYSGGTGKALDTQIVPLTHTGNLKLANGHLSVWDLTERAPSTEHQIGSAPPNLALYTRAGDGKAYGLINDTSSGVTVDENAGFLLVSRASSAAGRILYKNGVEIGAAEATAFSASDDPIYILARNVNGSIQNPSTDTIAFASIGGYLTAAEQFDLYNAVATYLTSVGAIGA